jgi:hypothetical protein
MSITRFLRVEPSASMPNYSLPSTVYGGANSNIVANVRGI